MTGLDADIEHIRSELVDAGLRLGEQLLTIGRFDRTLECVERCESTSPYSDAPTASRSLRTSSCWTAMVWLDTCGSCDRCSTTSPSSRSRRRRCSSLVPTRCSPTRSQSRGSACGEAADLHTDRADLRLDDGELPGPGILVLLDGRRSRMLRR